MTPIELNKLLYSAVFLLVIQIISHFFKRFAKQTQQRFNIRQSRYFAIKRLLTLSSLFVSALVLLLIWDVNLKHVWVSLTGLLALVAVAFFAVWSLVGNILAGVILYFTAPFKIDDTIMVLPDEVGGTVLAINTFYTVLIDENKNYINIPNSLFFQKFVKVVKNPVVRSLTDPPHVAPTPGMSRPDDNIHWPAH